MIIHREGYNEKCKINGAFRLTEVSLLPLKVNLYLYVNIIWYSSCGTPGSTTPGTTHLPLRQKQPISGWNIKLNLNKLPASATHPGQNAVCAASTHTLAAPRGVHTNARERGRHHQPLLLVVNKRLFWIITGHAIFMHNWIVNMGSLYMGRGQGVLRMERWIITGVRRPKTS